MLDRPTSTGWKRDGTRRARRAAKKATAPASAFRHASGHDDLTAVVGVHMLAGEAVEATAGWYPSRRGNSPRGPANSRSEQEARPSP